MLYQQYYKMRRHLLILLTVIDVISFGAGYAPTLQDILTTPNQYLCLSAILLGVTDR
jgi:hypothetical protein